MFECPCKDCPYFNKINIQAPQCRPPIQITVTQMYTVTADGQPSGVFYHEERYDYKNGPLHGVRC